MPKTTDKGTIARNEPEGDRAVGTVDTLAQGYVVCPSDRRFLLLFTFLKKNLKKKVIVFFSSCNSVKYHSELLNYIDVPVLDLHVRQLLQCFLTLVSLTPLPYLALFRESKNNKSGLRPFSNSEMPRMGRSCVQM